MALNARYIFQDYERVIVKTLKTFFKTYNPQKTRIAVNNIGPQVMHIKHEKPTAVYSLHFCTGTLVANNCARIDGGSHGILLQLEAGVSERCNKSLKV